jgi:UDP-N-acetylmuramoyl-L-alanyl-D-glutamate--2,6-diaminopimelate ligase
MNSDVGRLWTICKLPYHYLLAFLGAVIYRLPSRKLTVIAVTGTKGKSSVVELVNAILEEAGHTTTLANTLRFKVAGETKRNLYKMTMPGRFVLQSFLRKAVRAGCTHAIIEMTSEGARQYRHKFIELDALIFTNLTPEHIESHGSYENYVAAKVSLAKALERSPKHDKLLVVNGDDKESEKFLAVFSGKKIVYGKKDATGEAISSEGVSFNWEGVRIESRLPGEFNLYNILATVSFGKALGIPLEKIQSGIKKVTSIRGRAEKIEGADFSVIVDYAHTPDSLEQLYKTYAGTSKICVLGNCGGGRDAWKRPVMASIAEKYCDHVILTNEDPYDENPEGILHDMAEGMKTKNPLLILDRRLAIRAAIQKANTGDVVLISGKGTDPYIMGPHNTKQPWDDASVAREELALLHNATH